MRQRYPTAARARLRRHPAARLSAALAAAGLLGLSVTASPTLAQAGHSLTMSGPSTATIESPTIVQASGTVPPDVILNRYVNVYAIPTSVVATCPATFQNAIQISYSSAAQGGDTVALAVPAEGNFSLAIAYTPTVAGRFLLCGYLHEGVETMAAASMTITVSDPSATAAPANVTKPKVKRSGRRIVCKRGRWSGEPTRFAYHWTVGGKRKAGATRPTLRVTRKLRGRKVRCGVTATNDAGSTTALSRAARVR